MNLLSRRLHELNKQAIITEPEDARFIIEDEKEMQLHQTARKILGRYLSDLDDFKSGLDGSTCPVLSEADQALVDESNRFILKRFMLAFQSFGNAYVYYGNKMAEWVFWTRFLWLIDESQKYAVQVKAEEDVLGAPDFFKLCIGDQDERLKRVYDKWDHTLFSEESFKNYIEQTVERNPLPEPTPEEEAEAERQEREDEEFDKRVLAEKCPTCPKQCDWYRKEKEKRVSE